MAAALGVGVTVLVVPVTAVILLPLIVLGEVLLLNVDDVAGSEGNEIDEM